MKVLWSAVEGESVDEVGMGLAAVVVSEIISMASISAFCSPSEAAWYQLAVVS